MASIINIPGKLHNVTIDGVLASANEIYDDKKKMHQQNINADVSDTLKTVKSDITNLENNSGLLAKLINALSSAGSGNIADALKETADLNNKMAALNTQMVTVSNQLAGMSLVVVDENQYDKMVNEATIDENTLYFVTEVEE